MVQTVTSSGRDRAQPSVIIDRAYIDRLEALASAARRHAPVVGERLQGELMRAQIVDSAEMPPDIVSIGNAVTYRDETTGRERTVVLVFPGEADISLGRISVMTPIGVALLGLAENASFWWATRQGEMRRLTVTRVSPDVARTPGPATRPDDVVDETSRASFPASDPPGWTLGQNSSRISGISDPLKEVR